MNEAKKSWRCHVKPGVTGSWAGNTGARGHRVDRGRTRKCGNAASRENVRVVLVSACACKHAYAGLGHIARCVLGCGKGAQVCCSRMACHAYMKLASSRRPTPSTVGELSESDLEEGGGRQGAG